MEAALLDSLVTGVIEKPEVFVQSFDGQKEELVRKVTKHLFDFAKKQIPKGTGPLTELLVDGFDKEQIWGQIELQNKPLLKKLENTVFGLLKVDNILITKDKKSLLENGHTSGKGDKTSEDDEDLSQEDERGTGGEDDERFDEEGFGDEDGLEDGEGLEDEELLEDSKGGFGSAKSSTKKGKSKDRFFDIDDMEKFIEDAEEEEAKQFEREDKKDEFDDEEGEEGEDDLEDDLEEEGDDNGNVRYEGFFNEEQDNGEESEDELGLRKLGLFNDDDDKQKSKSPWQKQTERMGEQIKKLEEQNIADKPWLLKGEVTSRDRPFNSLLEATLDYERTSKPAPVITQEITSSIEDIIKKRIQDGTWDDVIRKVEPKKKFKPKIDMEEFQERSKLGLGEVMEKEYMKQTMGVEDPDKLDKNHKEIFDMFKKLCVKLDALSNFHYTPKPVVPEPTIKPNIPAIEMEEVAPVSVSTSNILAPEEVFSKKKKELKNETELTQEERKAMRRQKKTVKRKREKQKEADLKIIQKLNPGMGNPYAKEKALKSIQQDRNTKIITSSSGESTNTSSKLFKKLQEEAQAKIRGEEPKQKRQKRVTTVEKLKL